MNMPSLVNATLLAFTLVVGSLTGCQGTSFWQRNPDVYDKSQYGTTNSSRKQVLKDLADRAADLPADEQQQLSDQLYSELQEERSPILRLYLVRTLAKMNTPTSDVAFGYAVKDPDRDVQIAACKALGRRPGPGAVRVLSEVIGSESDVDVRLAATKALGQMKHPQAVNGIALALDDSDPALQRRAVESLKNVTGQDLGNDVVAWQQYVRNETRPGGTPAQTVADRSVLDRVLPW